MTATIIVLCLLSVVGLAFAAWLLRLPVICVAIVAAPLAAVPAHAQVGKVAPCNNGSCSKRIDAAAFPLGGKWTASQIDCSACPSGGTLPNPLLADGLKAGKTITGDQVSTCPAACPASGGSGAVVDRGEFLEAPKALAVDGGLSAGPSATMPMIRIKPGMWTVEHGNGFSGRLPDKRLTMVQVGELYCGANGDIYQVTAKGITAAEPPVTMPIARGALLALKAGQVVYPGWAGSDAPGFQYRTATACTTSRAPRVTWPRTVGATLRDGTCTYTAEAKTEPQFQDGLASFKFVPTSPDAYGCMPNLIVGQDAPNNGSIRANVGDNQGTVIDVARPQMAGPEYGVSMAETGQVFDMTVGVGDVRTGRPVMELMGAFDTRVLQVSGGAWLAPPHIPPVVTALAGGSLAPHEEQFTVAYRDARFASVTSACATASCKKGGKVTLTPGMQSVKVCFPEDGDFTWPIPPMGIRKSQTSVVVYRGSTEWWGNAWCVLRNPGECCVATKEDDFAENATLDRRTRTGIPLANVNNTRGYRQPWTPGAPVQAWRTIYYPSAGKETLRPVIAVGVNCDATGANCQRGMTPRGVTPTREPDWYQFPDGFILDDNRNLWMELPMSDATLIVDRSFVLTELTANGPRPALRITKDAVQFFDPNAPDPLRAVVREYTR